MCVHTGNLRQMHSTVICMYICYTHIYTCISVATLCVYLYDCDCQLSTHTVATLVKLCSLFLGWANSTLPPTHSRSLLLLLLSALLFLSFFTHIHTCKTRAQWSFSICMRFWIIYVLYCLIELCQVSLCAHLFLKSTKRASKQESEWRERVVVGERSKRGKLALVKLQRVVISVAFYLCFVCCCCCCCLSAVCVGACVRVPVCVFGAHALWLWKINNNNNQMTQLQFLVLLLLLFLWGTVTV